MEEAMLRAAEAPADNGPRLVPVEERVLSDLRHEVGNYLHKLYFWAEQARTDAEEAGRDVAPAEMLDRSLRSFQRFLGLALDYFRPLELEPVTVSGSDLARAAASAFRSAGEDVPEPRIEVREPAGETPISVDPARLADALRIVAVELGAASGVALDGRLAVARDGSALELEVRSTDGARRPAQPAVVAWAVAQRLLEAHGGSAEPVTEGGALAGGLLRLPLRTPAGDEDPCRRDS